MATIGELSVFGYIGLVSRASAVSLSNQLGPPENRPNLLHQAYNTLGLRLGADLKEVKASLETRRIICNPAFRPKSELARSKKDSLERAEQAAEALLRHLGSIEHNNNGPCLCKPYTDFRQYGQKVDAHDAAAETKESKRLHKAYEVLGLEPGAEPHDIHHRYRSLAKVWHPDRQISKEDKLLFEQQLKQINISKEVLSSHFESSSHVVTGPCACKPLPRLPKHASYAEPAFCTQFRRVLESFGQVEPSPKSAWKIHERACALLMLEQYDEAAADFSSLITFFPQEQIYYEKRALCYEKLWHHLRALADYYMLIALDGANPRYYSRRACVFNKLERYGEFLDDMRRAHLLLKDSDGESDSPSDD